MILFELLDPKKWEIHFTMSWDKDMIRLLVDYVSPKSIVWPKLDQTPISLEVYNKARKKALELFKSDFKECHKYVEELLKLDRKMAGDVS